MEIRSNPAGSEEYEVSGGPGFCPTMIGCSVSKEPNSPIVQKAEACGAGSLADTSLVAVQDWFGKHRDCAVAVDGMCKPVREKAPAVDGFNRRTCMRGSSEHCAMGAQAIRRSREIPVRLEVG